MHTGEVDLRNLQLTTNVVSSPLSENIKKMNIKDNKTKNINLIDRFQINSDLRVKSEDCENYFTDNAMDMNNLNATNDMYLAYKKSKKETEISNQQITVI